MPMAEANFDLVVVGGGPGGYVAAIRAAQLGMKTAVVEREQLGGICLNWGCIPTKALLRTRRSITCCSISTHYGFSAKDIALRRQEGRRALAQGGEAALRRRQLPDEEEQDRRSIDGEGKLAGKGKLAVTKDGKPVGESRAPSTSSSPPARGRARCRGSSPTASSIWTYKEAMVPTAMPKSLLVVGSGAIGIEFASFYRDLGAEVTVVEVLDRILPVEDEEISAFARKAFEKQGMKIHTGDDGEGAEEDRRRRHRDARQPAARPATVDGRARRARHRHRRQCRESRPRRHQGARSRRRHIVVDRMAARPASPGVYAIGDVVGPPWLAHKASHEGVICVEHIAGLNTVHPLDVTQRARLHLLPAAGGERRPHRGRRRRPRATRSGSAASPSSATARRSRWASPKGMVKTVFDAKTGELLGAHMIGAEVTELIQGYRHRQDAGDHRAGADARPSSRIPTLSEMMHEAVLDAYGRRHPHLAP